jgi:phenylacetate-CoA ligase
VRSYRRALEATLRRGRLTIDTPGWAFDSAALARYQLEALNSVLASARRPGRFYAGKLAGCPERLRSLAELSSLPLTTKEEVVRDVDEHPPFGSRGSAHPRGIRQLVTTSGTSGRGLEVYALSAADENALYAVQARGFAWASVGPGGIVANMLPMTPAAAGQWFYHALRRRRVTVLQLGTFTVERKLDYMSRFGPAALLGTPSYLMRIAAAAEAAGVNPRSLGLESLIMTGESWSLDWMRSLGEAFGARPVEQYGSTQRAFAWNCEVGAVDGDGRGVLHTFPDYAVYEVIDPAGERPAGPGEAGQLIVTPLFAEASPLIRFATGDRVIVSDPCRCGRPGLAFVSGRVDRFDYMVKIRGVNVWPEMLDAAVFGVAGVREYEAVVETDGGGRELFQVRVDLAATGDPAAAAAVSAAVERATGLHPATSVASPGSIVNSVRGQFTKRSRLVDRRSSKG